VANPVVTDSADSGNSSSANGGAILGSLLRDANSEEQNQIDYKSLPASPAWTDPGISARALLLANAFRRRQHYVESLLTCCTAARQCSMDNDALSYFRFRAKNEAIVCELTNARSRLRRTTGSLKMVRSRTYIFELDRLRLTIFVSLVIAAMYFTFNRF
jgi:hypothetical protein